jgi:peptidoglycan/LPS O-acetylase OafA/YrhL
MSGREGRGNSSRKPNFVKTLAASAIALESSVPRRPPATAPRFALADALRATAILAVVACHLLWAWSPLFSRYLSPALGYWGVDAFFVLSGFLLGRPYVDALLGRRALPNPTLYARRRFLRIWPAYAVVVLVTAAVTRLHHGANAVSAGDLAAHLLMVHNFSATYVSAGANRALWTMAVDAQFYVALPIVAWLIHRCTAERFETRRRVVATAIACAILVSVAWRAFAAYAFPCDRSDPSLLLLQRSLVGMGVCFGLGCLVALGQALRIAPSARQAVIVTAAGAFALALSITVAFQFPDHPLAPTAMDVLGAASVACLVFGLVNVRSNALAGLAGNGIVAALAANAYALYLVHFPVKTAIESAALRAHLQAGTLKSNAVILLAFVVTAPLLAYALHRFVEIPFLAMKENARESQPA